MCSTAAHKRSQPNNVHNSFTIHFIFIEMQRHYSPVRRRLTECSEPKIYSRLGQGETDTYYSIPCIRNEMRTCPEFHLSPLNRVLVARARTSASLYHIHSADNFERYHICRKCVFFSVSLIALAAASNSTSYLYRSASTIPHTWNGVCTERLRINQTPPTYASNSFSILCRVAELDRTVAKKGTGPVVLSFEIFVFVSHRRKPSVFVLCATHHNNVNDIIHLFRAIACACRNARQ